MFTSVVETLMKCIKYNMCMYYEFVTRVKSFHYSYITAVQSSVYTQGLLIYVRPPEAYKYPIATVAAAEWSRDMCRTIIYAYVCIDLSSLFVAIVVACTATTPRRRGWGQSF